jgi:hypothetical protein
MKKNFFKSLELIIKKLYLFFLNHKSLPIGIKNNDVQFGFFTIIDLNKSFKIKETKCLLCSYENDSTYSSSNEYPVIESWSKIKNISYSINDVFLYAQYKKLKKISNKMKIYHKEKVYLLPYYTSHFGHFSGDLLGQILYYIRYFSEINSKNKLLIITPSKKWDDFLIEFAGNNIQIMKPNEALRANHFFYNARILPRMSTVQNHLLAKNILNNEIKFHESFSKKIFLTTGRKDRISNLNELKKILIQRGYEIIIPNDYSIHELLNKIKSAEILISEKASVLNNVNIIRNKKYFVLSSKSENNLNLKLFLGAGIYKELDRGMINDIYCDDDPVHQRLRPYKKRIKVDINNLLSSIEKG